jgi:hypothetical protein
MTQNQSKNEYRNKTLEARRGICILLKEDFEYLGEKENKRDR